MNKIPQTAPRIIGSIRFANVLLSPKYLYKLVSKIPKYTNPGRKIPNKSVKYHLSYLFQSLKKRNAHRQIGMENNAYRK